MTDIVQPLTEAEQKTLQELTERNRAAVAAAEALEREAKLAALSDVQKLRDAVLTGDAALLIDTAMDAADGEPELRQRLNNLKIVFEDTRNFATVFFANLTNAPVII